MQLGEFQLPLDPSVRVGELECKKVFDSAQKPIWFQFANMLPDGPPVNIMFKVCLTAQWGFLSFRHFLPSIYNISKLREDGAFTISSSFFLSW